MQHRGNISACGEPRISQQTGCQAASWNENIEQRFDLSIISENMSRKHSHN